MKSKDIAGIEAGKLYPENWRHLTKAEQVGILDVNAEKRAAYIAGRTVGIDELDKQAEKILMSMMEENSPKLLQFFLSCIAKQMESANAGELELSCELDIKGIRYKIQTKSFLNK